MKRLILIFLSVITLFSIASCDSGSTGNSNTPEPPPAEEKVVEYKAMIRATDDIILSDAINSIYEKNGKRLPVMKDTNAALLCEIVFGDTSRQVTSEARELLDEKIDNDEDEIGFAVYKDVQGNIAVYWSNELLRDMAVSYFTDNYANLDLLGSFATGELYSKVLSLDEYLYETAWASVEENAPAEVAAALKSLAKMFDGSKIADWMANLWEPYICVCGNCRAEEKEIACYGGGFYYANSARDYEGFLPDMENTAFVLGWLNGNGALERSGNSYAKALPGEIKEKIIRFVQALQFEADGYFYHPQWGNNVSTDRRGRDLSNAVSVLKALGADPLYPTALDRLQKTVGSAKILTRPLSFDPVMPVASSFESSLASEESYMNWLRETTKNLFENTAGAHVINAGRTQIIAAGYLEITLNYFDEKQEELFNEMKAAYDADPVNNPEPTGLWQRNINYNAVWGLLKLAPFYDSGKREIKYAEYAMKTCVKCILIDAEDGESYQMNDVYNQWSSASKLISNVKKHNPDLLPRLYEIANENAVEMIDNSMAKLSKFIHEDGTYSYNQGTSAPSLYGTPVSLGYPEGDVNATILACGMYRSVFAVLGYDVVHMCDYRDGERFIRIISDLPSAEKREVATAAPLDFDNNSEGYSTSFNTGGYVEILPDPLDQSNSVLKYVTLTGGNDALNFTSSGATSAKRFVFEADILVESVSTSYFTQIYLGGVYMIDMLKSGDKIILRDNSTNTSTSNVTLLNFEADMGKWFNLRVEYYVDETNPTIKIYKDGTLVATSHNYYNSHASKAPTNEYTRVRFWAMRASDAVIYLDNVIVARDNKTLD